MHEYRCTMKRTRRIHPVLKWVVVDGRNVPRHDFQAISVIFFSFSGCNSQGKFRYFSLQRWKRGKPTDNHTLKQDIESMCTALATRVWCLSMLSKKTHTRLCNSRKLLEIPTIAMCSRYTQRGRERRSRTGQRVAVQCGVLNSEVTFLVCGHFFQLQYVLYIVHESETWSP